MMDQVTRQYRAQARNMAKLIVIPKDNLYDAMRCDGAVECLDCRLPYRDHPEIEGFPTFHIRCDGKVLKL